MDRVPQLEQLISAYHDGSLSQEERRMVDDAVAHDPAVAAEFASYEKLNRLLTSWRKVPQSVDWSAVRGRISKRVRSAAEEIATQQTPRDVDEFVADALGEVPQVDWQAFKNRVSTAVRDEAARQERDALLEERGYPARARLPKSLVWVTRVGVPLAAAAVIAFAFLLPDDTLPVQRSGVPGEAMVFVSLEEPAAGGIISISFDESAPAGLDEHPDELEGGVAMTIVQPAAMARVSAESDEAYFY